MIALYGKHESLLNELKTRFEVKLFLICKCISGQPFDSVTK